MCGLNPIAKPFVPGFVVAGSGHISASVSGGSDPNASVFTCLNFELFIMFLFTDILSSQIVLCLLDMSGSVCSDGDSPRASLQSLRLKNLERIIVGHLNINSVRNKIGLLDNIVRDRLDILLVSDHWQKRVKMITAAAYSAHTFT